MRAGTEILNRIVSPERPTLDECALVVVAHPDDETLACGALLSRLRKLTIVHVTDGAPGDGGDARRHGFSSGDEYASARRRELDEALAAGHVGGARLIALDIPDQGATPALADIARRLVPEVRTADLVLTHAFEGGHPDHDATAVAVHAVAALLPQAARPVIVEMPLYRAGPDDEWLYQSFPPDDGDDLDVAVLRLTPAERARKQAMIAAHRSQQATLAGFGAADEHYRMARAPDSTALPNGGRILYDRYGWGMSGGRFVELARSALAELGLERLR